MVTGQDRFGQVLTVADPSTIDGWDTALREIQDFRGEPADRLHELTTADESFVMGLVVTISGAVLGGDDPLADAVQDDLMVLEARSRTATRRERDHAMAVTTLVDGDLTEAAARWDAIGVRHPHDMVATRTAHDVYLHVGDDPRRVEATAGVMDRLVPSDPGHGIAAGQHAFALEECGRYVEAEQFARLALEVDPVDIWALHALAHVFEMQGRHDEAVDHLRSTRPDWIERDHLALHLDWHLALRLIAAQAFDEVLALVDDRLPTTDRAFGLADLTSLLWRLELAGCDVGDRWTPLTARWRGHDQLHTTGFLDLHAALAFSACPDDRGADPFWLGLDACHRDAASENDHTFELVVRPLAAAVRSHREGRYAESAGGIEALTDIIHRVGGSHAQRDVFAQTATASLRAVASSATSLPDLPTPVTGTSGGPT